MNQPKYLNDELQNRNNGVDILKMAAAMLVILSHSIPITRGSSYEDVLSLWTDGYLNLGGVAVAVFFFFGGLYIAKSMESKQKAVPFFKARCKRIFPELWIVVLGSIFIIGLIFTKLSLADYLGDKGTWKYLLNGIFFLQHNLPGVFNGNPYPNVINGPLWTLPVEFLCYIACFIMYKLGLFQKKWFAVTIPFALLLLFGSRYYFQNNTFLLTVIRPVFLFYMGILAYVFREKIKLSGKYAVVAFILFIAALLMKWQLIALVFFFPYVILWVAYQVKKENRRIKFEYTYGMYLWGWPIQQCLTYLTHGTMSWYMNAVIAILLAAIIGYMSNQLVSRLVK